MKTSASATDGPAVSVVISCYFEENTINEFHARLRAALGSTGRSFELVFVNDGSTDGTFEQLRAIFERDETVTAILDLSRNFGQGNAIAAGIREASGEAVLLLDSDLQLDPEDASKLLDTFFAQDLDVVTGYRMNRRDSISRRLPSLLANVIMRRISRHALRDFGCTFTVLNAHIVRSLWRDESWTYRLTDIAAQTRRVAEIAVNHHPRPNGKSGWTFRKLWSYNMDNLVVLSERPFQYLAAFAGLGAFLLLTRVSLGYFADFSILPGVSTALILNALVGSTLFLFAILCLLGEYVTRTFNSLRGLPKFIVRTRVRRDR